MLIQEPHANDDLYYIFYEEGKEKDVPHHLTSQPHDVSIFTGQPHEVSAVVSSSQEYLSENADKLVKCFSHVWALFGDDKSVTNHNK